MLQFVAVCCIVLQCGAVAVCCSMLQLQHSARLCNTQHCVHADSNTLPAMQGAVGVSPNTKIHVKSCLHCNTLQLQHTAIRTR